MNHSKLHDQVVFTFGVFWVALTAYLSGAFPELAPQIFIAKCIILLAIRAYVYCSSKNKYFMFDFCYFTNLLILGYLYFLPRSQFLFKLLFACSLGPLSWAVPAWRNSLVFHSLDKMTSVFIHLGPPLLMYELRWIKPPYGLEIDPNLSWTEALVYPMGFYFLWQLYYYVRVFLLSRKDIEDNQLWTSYHYLTSERNKDSWLYPAYFAFGPEWSRTMFMIVQAGYTLTTLLPVKFFYQYQFLHFLFYVMMFLICSWNGATFYFKIFAKRYDHEKQANKNE